MEIRHIAEALTHNKAIAFLNLDYNEIGDEGAERFIDALSHNVCIVHLYVSGSGTTVRSRRTIQYLAEIRNAILIPAAVRRASLYLITARLCIANAGEFSVFPKEIVRMIAMQVWATRKDPKWIEAVNDAENTALQQKQIDEWVQQMSAYNSD